MPVADEDRDASMAAFGLGCLSSGVLGTARVLRVDGGVAQMRMKITASRRRQIEHVPQRIQRVVVAIFLTGLG